MAVQERQARGTKFHNYSSNIPIHIYDAVTDWAWENRLSFARASAILLEKAVRAERGEPYEIGKDALPATQPSTKE